MNNYTSCGKDSKYQKINQLLAAGASIAAIFNLIIYIASLINQDILLISISLLLAAIIGAGTWWFISAKCFARFSLGWITIIFVSSIALTVWTWSWFTHITIRPVKVTITKPVDGEHVNMRYLVQGTVDDPHSKVHVIVHPLSVSSMWVQPPPLVNTDGRWKTNVYFGTHNQGTDEKYEVVALATNENFLVNLLTGNSLREGQILKGLPRITNRSNIVTVTRAE